jgi:hypothetical protein
MTVKINERFSVERDPMQWILVETRPGESKSGKPIERIFRSYYYQFSALCSDLIEKCPQEASDLREVVATIKEVKATILAAVELGRLHELVKQVGKDAQERRRLKSLEAREKKALKAPNKAVRRTSNTRS